jgi:hypothetical protein
LAQDFAALATKCLQKQGEGDNINVAELTTSSNRGHWKHGLTADGTFSDTVERSMIQEYYCNNLFWLYNSSNNSTRRL